MGVLSCLRRAEFNWNFVWSVDVPFLPDTAIKDMAAAAVSGEAAAAVLQQNGWAEPLICALHRRVAPVTARRTMRRSANKQLSRT
jgi:molybdopterin-guanine dinucleotide biosynthesis protein A